MSIYTNYLSQDFQVTDPDARIRTEEDLLKFARDNSGKFRLIPKGTKVRIDEVSPISSGNKTRRIFARVSSTDGKTQYGWTSTRNFDGMFRNVTLGLIEPAKGAGKYSTTAAWKKGTYTGQVSLVLIVDNALHIERLTGEMAEPYFSMIHAAKSDGVAIHINSGFRTYAEQKHLYDSYRKGIPGYNLAAKPGRSNHQNGIALDIPVAGGAGNGTYDWLAEHATAHGFIRTVKSEPWHWEYRPSDAAKANAKGSHKSWA